MWIDWLFGGRRKRRYKTSVRIAMGVSSVAPLVVNFL